MLLRSLMAAAALVVTAAACSCTDPAWCQPLSSPPAKQELFVFTVTPGAHANYNWTYLTTIVAFYDLSSDPTLLCEAHSRNVRVILQADDFPLANLTDASQRAAWVSTQVARVAASGADGVNVDIESPITSEDQPALLTALVSSLAMAMHAANKAYQVSFDVAWGPNNVDGRSYDYVGLGNAVDLMFVMGYDERSQVWTTPCVAGANAGLPQTQSGVDEYLALGISADKLILGTPWYGRLYPCLSLVGNVCNIALVPFRGCNCSDAAANEIALEDISIPPGGPTWDNVTSSEFFNINGTHQMWYDDARSLSLKYALARSKSLHGVGMWTADFSTAVDMWAAFDAFFIGN